MSRLAFDMVVEERDQLRARIERLDGLFSSVQRRAAGLPEQPKALPRVEAQAPAVIPEEIQAMIDGFDSGIHRANVEDQVRRLYAAGAPWSEITKMLGEEVGDAA